MAMDLSNDTKFVRVSAAVAAGTSLVTPPTAVDTLGWDGVVFLWLMGAITSGALTSAKAQQSAAAASGFSDIAGSAQSIADTDDGSIIALDIRRPRLRYVLPLLVRGTQNAALDGIVAILYRGTVEPPLTQDVSLSRLLLLVSPATGAA